MRNWWLKILTFTLLFALLAGGRYHWLEPKVVDVDFKVHSLHMDSMRVFFDVTGEFEAENSHLVKLSSYDSTDVSFSFERKSFPVRIGFRLYSDLDSVWLNDIDIRDDLGTRFSFDDSYNGSSAIQTVEFPSATDLVFRTDQGESLAQFRISSVIPNSRPFTSLTWFWVCLLLLLSGLIVWSLFPLLSRPIDSNISFALGFLFIIFSGVLNFFFPILQEPLNQEKRQLAAKPHSEGMVYKQEFEDYLIDHYAPRPYLTYWHSLGYWNFLRTSSQPDKIAMNRHNGNMFPYGMESMDDYQHKAQYPPQYIVAMGNHLIERQLWFHARQIPYIFVLFPNKHNLMSHEMPSHILPGFGTSRMKNLTNYLNSNQVDYLDLSDYMESKVNASKNPTFYKYDLHWNNLGAFFGYQKMIEEIEDRYHLGLEPHQISDFDTSTAYYNDGDLAQSMLLHNDLLKREVEFKPNFERNIERSLFYRTKTHGELVINHSAPNDLTVVVFRDSYTVNLLPFLTDHFRKTVFIWSHEMDLQVLDEHRPNLVIHEMAEIYLPKLLTPNPKRIQLEVESLK